jgi:hypothetical protein
LTGGAKKAYAIYDQRPLLQHYAGRPPFELAIFDRLSKTSSKQDFAPVEAALIAACFAMSENRVIVSDGKKAALLEFSGVA